MSLLENIAYNTGVALAPMLIFVFVLVMTIVAGIALVQYYNSRRHEGSFITIVKNTWNGLDKGGRLCVYALLGGVLIPGAIKVLFMLYFGW